MGQKARATLRAVSRPLLFAAAAAFLSLSLGCADGPLREARARDTAAAWRTYLASDPDPREREQAEERLRELVHAEAIQAHSLVGYKRFLDEFPTAPEAAGIRARLAGLRFLSAEAQGTATAWRAFLREHPDAPQSAEATTRLREAELAEARASEDPRALARLDREGAAEEGTLLSAEADQALFHSATTSRALLAYLREQPSGRHREAARAALLRRELEGLLVSGKLLEAQTRYAQSPLASLLPELPARFRAEAQQRAALASPDPLVQSAQAAHYLRSLESLTRALRAPDPMDRWQAAQELGHHVSIDALGPLLEALEPGQHPLVRQRALAGLWRVVSALPPAVAEHELSVRIEALAPNAASPERGLLLAILLDAAGRLEEASVEYQRAYDAGAPDPLILRRWMELRATRGQWYSAAVAARQLARWAHQLAADEAGVGAAGVPPLSPARRLCAAFELAVQAEDTLREASVRAREFSEDLPSFARVAEEAVALARARLGDAELRLRERHPAERTCGQDPVAERLTAGEQQRAQSLQRLSRERPAQAGLLISRARTLDPAPGLRTLAAGLQGTVRDLP